MRTFSRSGSLAACGAILTTALALLGGRPAAAQTVVGPTQYTPAVGVRFGAYFPQNSRVTHSVGNIMAGGGVDVTVQHSPGTRVILSLDYIDRSNSGRNLRLTPLTIGVYGVGTPSGGITPYYGLGVGAYFVHSNLLTNTGTTSSANTTSLGGYLAAGIQFQDNVFLEGRYHVVQESNGVNTGGLQVTVGYRF